jgi:predicted O-methyltransferase YrrM
MKLPFDREIMIDKFDICGIRARIASSVLNKKARKCKTPADYVNLAFDIFHHKPLSLVGWSIEPLQIKLEIETLLSILGEQSISTLIEIGTANGGTLFLFTRIIDPNARLISLDLPHGKFGGGYEDIKIPFFTNFAERNQRIFLVQADSHSASSLSTVKSILKDQEVDFLFIDGDHTYEGVKKDFQMYSQLVHKGGLVAFHDICRGPPELAGAVNKFWNEIKPGYVHKEIVNSSNQVGYGIGVLYI